MQYWLKLKLTGFQQPLVVASFLRDEPAST
jgi:hypothetical protein